MILLNIFCKEKQQAIDIAHLLLDDRYILDANIIETTKISNKKNGVGYDTRNCFLLTGKTKALLFPTIDKILIEKYPINMPELFSVPIVNMDWEQAKTLISETIKT